jgi:hypothetical protein
MCLMLIESDNIIIPSMIQVDMILFPNKSIQRWNPEKAYILCIMGAHIMCFY